MIEGKTSSGFEYQINENIANDYRLLRMAKKIQNMNEKNAVEVAVDFPELLLGEEGIDKLMDFLTERDGYPKSSEVLKESMEIMQLISKEEEVKNS